MKINKFNYKIVFFLSSLLFLQLAFSEDTLHDQINTKRKELRAVLTDIPLNDDDYLAKSIETWEALFQFKLELKISQCSIEKHKQESLCTKSEAELLDSKKLTICSVRADHVWYQHLKLEKEITRVSDEILIRHDQEFLKENYKTDDDQCSKIVAHEKKRIAPPIKDQEHACKWSEAFPRRIITLNGCGKSKTNFCTGHVVCGSADGSQKKIKLVTCSRDNCDFSDPDKCLKDSKYKSQVFDGGVKDFSEQVKQMIASPTKK